MMMLCFDFRINLVTQQQLFISDTVLNLNANCSNLELDSSSTDTGSHCLSSLAPPYCSTPFIDFSDLDPLTLKFNFITDLLIVKMCVYFNILRVGMLVGLRTSGSVL